ncbi:MAG TPA: hypothetical protein VGB53_00390, partial [Rubricoccaceae bacterium]
RAGSLDVEAAGAVLRAFQDGEFSATRAASLAPLATARTPVTAALVEALGPARDARGRALAYGLERVRAQATIDLVESFDQTAAALGQALTRGGPVAEWHRAMRAAVTRDLVRQYQLGVGRITLQPSELVRLDALAAEQARYLERFAGEITTSALQDAAGTGKAMSRKQIVARSRQYAGVGRQLFYEASEAGLQPPTETRGGFLVRYLDLDDEGTCSECSAAAAGSPYAPGEGPFPGTTCRGRGLCRCRRETYYVAATGRVLPLLPRPTRLAA